MILELALVALAFSPAAAPTPTPATKTDSCTLAPALRDALQQRFGSTRVLKVTDLFEDERKLYLKDHGGACPGLAAGKFFGSSERPATAIVLLDVGPRRRVHLVVARPALSTWTLFDVDEMDEGSTAVTWREGPGSYTDSAAGKTLRADNDVVALTAYETWQRVYVWTGRKFETLKTGD